MKHAIEDSFPIVAINRLAVPERNAFKPIYQMHKWFARRASCVFRAILLGALKPLPVDKDGKPLKSGAEVIMEEFYKDHTNDPDTNGKVILDPFMGGGTTVVEALRLGCKVIGIDLNPVAWFIVKTEVEPVDLVELEAAFERLANRTVEWSGKPLRETLLDLYKTVCPCCGQAADIIYTFWVKEAPCTSATCHRQTPLYSDYILASKTPTIRYLEDCDCSKCGRVFDWEIEPACMIGNPEGMVNAGRNSAGQGRSHARWSYGRAEQMKGGGLRGSAPCPWCGSQVTPGKTKAVVKRKKVELTILLCPKCEEVWQYRGPLPEAVQCPTCKSDYAPHNGNVPGTGKFLCGCGNETKVIEAIRSLPEEQRLPMRPYGMECYCAHCAERPSGHEAEQGSLFSSSGVPGERGYAGSSVNRGSGKRGPGLADRVGKSGVTAEEAQGAFLWKNSGKFYKRIEPADLSRYQEACERWEKSKAKLPYPKSEIPVGEKTKSGLLAHHYRYWHQMFNPRQLLALSSLLDGIGQEDTQLWRELLFTAFMLTLEANNLFTWQITSRSTPGGTAPGGVLRRHDFAPKMRICEQNVWGVVSGNNTFLNRKKIVAEGFEYAAKPWDHLWEPEKNRVVRNPSNESFQKPGSCELLSADSRCLPTSAVDFVVTDPPYADNVNYSELSDFFHVWFRLLLGKLYPQFAPEYTPKTKEIIENRTRGLTAQDFERGLTEVFGACQSRLKQDGLVVFTFHHREGAAWQSLLKSICDAGLEIIAVYPIHGEREESLHLMDKEGAIAYDLIHVCRTRVSDPQATTRSWAGVRQEIRRKAREEIRAIEAGRYGSEPLAGPDVNIILIGKCLELYSRHYGNIVDHEGEPVPLTAALEEIRMLVDQLTITASALPSELEEIDAPSYVYLTCLCDRKEIKSDEVSKSTRGICEPSTLMACELMIKGRAKRGRTYEVKQPLERLDLLKRKFQVGASKGQEELFHEDLSAAIVPGAIFIDYVHLLIALVQTGESVLECLDRFRGRRPELRAALEYLGRKNRSFAEPVQKLLGLMDEQTLFNRGENGRA